MTTLKGIRLDPARLKQVPYNCLSNAIKFTPANGTVALRIMPAAAESMFRLEVQDTEEFSSPVNILEENPTPCQRPWPCPGVGKLWRRASCTLVRAMARRPAIQRVALHQGEAVYPNDGPPAGPARELNLFKLAPIIRDEHAIPKRGALMLPGETPSGSPAAWVAITE